MTLLAFIALYVGLTAWFGIAAALLVRSQRYFFALVPFFFGLVLLRGLVGVRRAKVDGGREVTDRDEPQLMAFVRKIAADAKARPPHRVFLAPGLEAGVFYDVSLLGLIFPTRRSLVLGLGLINTLTVDELKAVLAHEFGHFGQSTMAIGRWVYFAQQVAGHVVATRGFVDGFARGLSRVRLTWVGWLLQLVIWSIRAVVDTAFRATAVANRALSRQMEFHADLVAVSLSGSDSLVHALHVLDASGDAWQRAMNIAIAELQEGRPVRDVYRLQIVIMKKLRTILDDPHHGVPPAIRETDAGKHRIFKESFAKPPTMWSTHPPNRDREDNAKAVYFRSTFDRTPAWALFRDAEQARHSMTRDLLGSLWPAMHGGEKGPLPPPPQTDDAREKLDKAFERQSLDKAYRGIYLSRSAVLDAERVEQLYEKLEHPALSTVLADPYPEALKIDLKKARGLEEDFVLLSGLKEGFLEAPGGILQYRGRPISRSSLGTVVSATRKLRDAARDKLREHSRRCRSAHRVAARAFSEDWDRYLVGLLSLLHYLEHTEADLKDALGALKNTFDVVVADGRVTRSEHARLVEAATEAHHALMDVWNARFSVTLDPSIAQRLGGHRWAEALPRTFDLPPPHPAQIGEWLEALETWTPGFVEPLEAASTATLEVLLAAERHVRTSHLQGTHPGDAPEPPEAPNRYVTRCPGTERKRATSLDLWSRFVLADGWWAIALRLTVALAVLVPILYGVARESGILQLWPR